jgi:ribosomal protein L11 methyltransferase
VDTRNEAAWVTLRVEVSEAAADAIGCFLLDHGAGGLLTAASDDPDPCGPGLCRLEAHFAPAAAIAVLAALAEHTPRLQAIFPGTILTTTTTALPPIDWQATFRAHHHPIAVGRRLLVAPPWDVPAAPGREILIIEPGMAFGTGQHATTRGCLEEIEAAVDTGTIASALDVGTGSGLLAAALARLGVPDVVAVDNDRAVLALARDNLRGNRAGRVSVVGGTAGCLRRSFDLVVANLLLDVIVGGAVDLAARVAPHGRLILSGLLITQVDAAVAAFPGWEIATQRDEDPWATLRLVRTH